MWRQLGKLAPTSQCGQLGKLAPTSHVAPTMEVGATFSAYVTLEPRTFQTLDGLNMSGICKEVLALWGWGAGTLVGRGCWHLLGGKVLALLGGAGTFGGGGD